MRAAGRPYHLSSVCLQQVQQRSVGATPPPAATSAREIGIVTGLACPFNDFGDFGDRLRRVHPGAFTESLRTMRPTLQIDHGGRPVAGRMSACEAPDGVRFLFRVYDTADGRDLMRRGKLAKRCACSIGYTPTAGGESEVWSRELKASVSELRAVRLHEISVLFNSRPAWLGTRASFHSI